MAGKQDGCALRATFVIDPEGIIRWASACDLQVDRSVNDVLRALDALQSPSKRRYGSWESTPPTASSRGADLEATVA